MRPLLLIKSSILIFMFKVGLSRLCFILKFILITIISNIFWSCCLIKIWLILLAIKPWDCRYSLLITLVLGIEDFIIIIKLLSSLEFFLFWRCLICLPILLCFFLCIIRVKIISIFTLKCLLFLILISFSRLYRLFKILIKYNKIVSLRRIIFQVVMLFQKCQ